MFSNSNPNPNYKPLVYSDDDSAEDLIIKLDDYLTGGEKWSHTISNEHSNRLALKKHIEEYQLELDQENY